MNIEDQREIGHFLTGRYPSLLPATQKRLIHSEREARAKLEEYREASRKLLNGDAPQPNTRQDALDRLTAPGQAMGDYNETG